jgi:hydantoinase/carbamoylase family amidase
MSQVKLENLENHFWQIAKIGNLGKGLEKGFLRAAYSDEETAAFRYIEEQGKSFGLVSRQDALGNLTLETPGTFSEYVEVGSHLDTVPAGGNFDGVVGIISGLEAIRSIVQSGSTLKKGLRLRIWRAEESGTFGVVYGGSLGAFGELAPLLLESKFGGTTYEEAIKSQGFDPKPIQRKERTISQREVDSIAAHLELHIEQGNLLEIRNLDIGIVTSIRGPERYRVFLTGEFDHSGATPMGVEFRKDVNLALGYMIVELDQLANSNLSKGADLVQTIGVINCEAATNQTNPDIALNALTKVSGCGYFTLEIRSNDNDFKKIYSEQAIKIIDDVAKRFNVSVKTTQISSVKAQSSLDLGIQETFKKSCDELKYTSTFMASGGGHDCAVVAKQKKSDGSTVPIGLLFIPCRGGKSHSTDEYSTFDQIFKGAQVLEGAIKKLATA